ncbi:TP53-regulated inhibitor of apoptosis 1-like [Paramuricea clavata]|uniref:TP53-regulated inhibitor of apoptosis 1-like n=1 Tax=Paramuricea clavata TaxID=317549 RepID=A0A7D9EQ68_PARCT|nr:TP53-regulated inhibitor of apoptosis 1-like [Paramuricea clavata]
MNSISEECNDLKKSYDACFNSWYTEKFLQGETSSEPCRELFESYRACVLKALKDKNISVEEVEKDVLGTHNEKKAPDAHATES